MHALLSAAYFRLYQRLDPDVAARVRYWLLPVAVARTARGAPVSRRLLLHWIAQLTDKAQAL
jgi:hypothetical protein